MFANAAALSSGPGSRLHGPSTQTNPNVTDTRMLMTAAVISRIAPSLGRRLPQPA